MINLKLGTNSTSSVEELKQVGDSLVEKVQTGELSQQAQLEVVSLSITDPLPEPVDPTGGVRATNETGKYLFHIQEVVNFSFFAWDVVNNSD